MERQTRLYEAALKGDVDSLINLFQEDPLILDLCMEKSSCFMQSPLHVAAKMGHKEIIETILERKSNMIFAHDEDGRTLIHVAAMNGHTQVLEMLHRANPHATRVRTNRGETALHLCVKHNQAGALQLMLHHTDDELLNSKDDDGNTVLHLAVIGQQRQMVEMLLGRPKMEKNEVNNNGLTALDSHMCILVKERRDGYYDIEELLENAKALRAKDALKRKERTKWLDNQSNALMVVASLIATMAFQFGTTNPPGGFWQEDKLLKETSDTKTYEHLAGTPVLYDQFKKQFCRVMVLNTIAFVSSLSVILLLISGLPYSRIFMAVLRITMWIAVSATTATYAMSLAMTLVPDGTDPRKERKPDKFIICVWVSITVILLIGHALYFLVKLIRRKPTLPSKILRKLGFPV
ncbi:hypothetical protein BVRB_2g032550 [Beta vulgaris subsp. vulgaris]|nr:hypothetical protein BVRB_2g032550 [Beta vulgaris subsp. vulgaris]